MAAAYCRRTRGHSQRLFFGGADHRVSWSAAFASAVLKTGARVWVRDACRKTEIPRHQY